MYVDLYFADVFCNDHSQLVRPSDISYIHHKPTFCRNKQFSVLGLAEDNSCEGICVCTMYTFGFKILTFSSDLHY